MASKPDQDFSHLKDILGTLPMVKRYIVLSLFFRLDKSTQPSEVEAALQQGLAQLAKAFPWLTGQVVYEGRNEEENITGVPVIKPLSSTIRYDSKNLRDDSSFPSISELEAARYPFSMLDTSILTQPVAVSWASDAYNSTTAPVLMIQATLIRDNGLIVTVSGNHAIMDMTGMGFVIGHFAKACRGEQFTDEEIQQGNQPRENVIPLLDDSYQPGDELKDLMVKDDSRSKNPPSPLYTNPHWVYFHISASNQALLKSEAGKQDIVPYISTDDALAALCWQRLSTVRASIYASDPQSPPFTSTFARPMSVRTHFNLQGYTGQMVDVLHTTLPTPVQETPLPIIAGNLRHSLRTSKEPLTYHVRAFATHLSRLQDKSRLAVAAGLDLTQDLVLSSYANNKCCEMQFGKVIGGSPIAARRPRTPAWPGQVYLMPKEHDGAIAFAMCCSDAEIEGLRNDEVFCRFAQYVG